MTDDFKAKLSALLKAHAEQAAKRTAADKMSSDQTDRRACGEPARECRLPRTTAADDENLHGAKERGSIHQLNSLLEQPR